MRSRILFPTFYAPSVEFIFDAFCLFVSGVAGFNSAIASNGDNEVQDHSMSLNKIYFHVL